MSELIKPVLGYFDEDRRRSIKVLCYVIAGYYVTDKVVRGLFGLVKKRQIKKKIKATREKCQRSKEQLDNYLKGLKIPASTVQRIINLSFHDLQSELQSGKLTAVDVLHAYQIKALEVDRRLNCITDVVTEAEELAIALDNDTGKKGPLFGIPVSIKETYYMPGYPSTGGMVYYLDRVITEENVLVKILKKQGAIPFVRTNVPQTLMAFECNNSIYGETVNPHDSSRVPGGSSGGESALIGGGGSILGMGGDIGGSVRIPAHMAGCCSIKPTGGRLSRKGQIKFNKGSTLVQAQTGPMAQEVDSLVACMRCLLVPEMFTIDPVVPPLPFQEELFNEKKKLTIGFYVDDGNLQTSPSCRRAVLEVKAILEAQGHTLVPFKPVDVFRAFRLFVSSVLGDGGQSYMNVMESDIPTPLLSNALRSYKLHRHIRSLLSYIIGLITKDKFTSIVLEAGSGSRNISEYWDLAMQIEAYKADFLKKWTDNQLDAVIAPGFSFPANPVGKTIEVMGGSTITTLYNLLDYPAGTLQVTRVTKVDLDNFQHYQPRSLMEKCIKKFSEGSIGLPVGVQFVGLPYHEERLLRLMKDVETYLRKNNSP